VEAVTKGMREEKQSRPQPTEASATNKGRT
jgi:hypothetical protein